MSAQVVLRTRGEMSEHQQAGNGCCGANILHDSSFSVVEPRKHNLVFVPNGQLEPVLSTDEAHHRKGCDTTSGELMAEFRGGLDKRIVSAIVRSGAALNLPLYNQYHRLPKSSQHFRLQAAEAFPLLGAVLAETSRAFTLVQAVDNQHPLVPALAKELNAPASVVRWLMGKDAGVVGILWVGRIKDLAAYLTLLCPEHRPYTAQDWCSFNSFVSAIDQTYLENRERGCEALSFYHRQWLKELGKMGWSTAMKRFVSIDALPEDLSGIPDLLEEIAEIVSGQICPAEPREVVALSLEPYMEKIFFSKGIIHQVRTFLLWYRSFLMPTPSHLVAGSAKTESLESWPAAFDGVIECHGLRAICLTNRHQLKEEGNRMRHCVGNYAERCLFAGVSIISLRGHDCRPIATAELALAARHVENDLRFYVRKHNGVRNSAPPAEAEVALCMIVNKLNAKEFESRRGLLHHALHERKTLRREQTKLECSPWRLAKLKESLKMHVGYERFLQAAVCAVRDSVHS